MKVHILLTILVVLVSQGAEAEGVCSSCGSCPCCLGVCLFGCQGICIPIATPGMSAEEACHSNAVQIIKSDCKTQCNAGDIDSDVIDDPGTDCATCITGNLEGTCKELDALEGSCFQCSFAVIRAVYSCRNEPTISAKADCVINKVPGNCKNCLCNVICKSSNSVAKAICQFLQSSGLCPKTPTS